ncbi:MAG: WbqC family protein [Bacteroidetes bacterium]|nr:WbqC family protein [Bacteroidota bacterium]
MSGLIIQKGTLPADEIYASLQALNGKFFHIEDLSQYASKVETLAKALFYRSEDNQLITYILYYDNGPEIFITMVWTHPDFQNKGLATNLLSKLVDDARRPIQLDVHKANPALRLYQDRGFRQVRASGDILTLNYTPMLAIMQPYIFPYIGYFQLMAASAHVVFYDDVNFIKKGWINRNKILLQNTEFLFTVPLIKASQNKLICELEIQPGGDFEAKFMQQLHDAYKRAPYYNQVIGLIKELFARQPKMISDLAIESVSGIFQYLSIPFTWSKSSVVAAETRGMDRADRLISITKQLHFTQYINNLSGSELYEKEYFANKGVNLHFLKAKVTPYKQFNDEFVSGLSIIDILMFNDIKAVRQMLHEYQIL